MILPAPAVRLLVLASALVLDLSFGELPNCLHPVAGMGTFIRAWVRRAPADGAVVPWLFGAALTMSGIAVFSLLWFLLSQAGLPSWLWVAIGALGLKAVIAPHRLLEAAGAVERALQAGDLAAARRSVGWNSVSRETDDLDVGHVASAAVESLAENPVDILVAPILAYALGGLPAAWAYRFVNTADAMTGCRDPRHEFLRKFAARLDDVLNWIPARLAGLLLVIAGAMAGGDWRGPGASCWNSMVAHRAPTPGGRWPPPAPWASAWRKRGRIVWTAGANSPAGRLSAAPADWWRGPVALVCSSAQR